MGNLRESCDRSLQSFSWMFILLLHAAVMTWLCLCMMLMCLSCAACWQTVMRILHHLRLLPLVWSPTATGFLCQQVCCIQVSGKGGGTQVCGIHAYVSGVACQKAISALRVVMTQHFT